MLAWAQAELNQQLLAKNRHPMNNYVGTLPGVIQRKQSVFSSSRWEAMEAMQDLQADINADIGFDGMDTADLTNFECPPGHQCLFPFMQNWVSCPPGTYSADNFYGCQPCEDKFTCLQRGNTATAVENGFYSLKHMHIPMPTPAGFESQNPTTDSTLAPCKAGYWSDDMAQTCTQC